MSGECILDTKGLSVGYDGSVVLSGIDLQLSKGELVCLLGINGSGKSTLLRTLAGLQKPLAGNIVMNGHGLEDLSRAERARLVSVVLTASMTGGTMNVCDLVAHGRHPHTGAFGNLSDEDIVAIDKAMELTATKMLSDRDISELSDGERQRALIARAIAQDTPLIVLDEPTSFLDVRGKAEILSLLKRLSLEQGSCIVFASHDLPLVLDMADRCLLIDDGRLIEGTPKMLLSDGTLSRIFCSDSVSLDPGTGALKINI